MGVLGRAVLRLAAALALLAPRAHLAHIMGLYRFLVDGAVIIAPWLTGRLIERHGYRLPARGTAVVLILTAPLVAWGLRPVRGRA
jgi:hypothetical protein